MTQTNQHPLQFTAHVGRGHPLQVTRLDRLTQESHPGILKPQPVQDDVGVQHHAFHHGLGAARRSGMLRTVCHPDILVGFSANSAALFAERLTHPGFQVDLRVYPLEVRADPRSWNR